WQTRGRAALALAETKPVSERAALLAEASLSASALIGEGAAWARPLALLLRAGAASLGGGRGREASLALLVAADEEAHAAGLMVHHLVAAKQAGALVGRVSSAAPLRKWERWVAAH